MKQITTPVWRNRKWIPVLIQIAFVIAVFMLFFYFIRNALTGLQQIGITVGFSFLSSTASFSIGETIIEYSPTDSYGYALLVGFLNTLKVAFWGVILASIIGFFIGMGRLSKNGMVRTVSTAYVELFRNTPLLVQIFIWYFAVFLPLPRIEEAKPFLYSFFTNRGIVIPFFETGAGATLVVGAFFTSMILAVYFSRYWNKIGNSYSSVIGLIIVAVITGGAFLVTGGQAFTLSLPEIEGSGFVGGYRLTPEFAAILLALSIYTSTFIAEIVRAGILGVPKGQIEAARALGLREGDTLRSVILPQAVRIIIPPLTSQYLNLTKNSSLAIAVGYPDIVSVGYTIQNQTGRAVECILVLIAVYLTFSLLTSLIMNGFNKKYQLVER